MEIRDQGQVRSISLPDGWLEKPQGISYGGVGSRALREFHSPDQESVRFCFFYRGLPVSSQGGALFRKLLDQPAHRLMLAEMQTIDEILRDRANARIFSVVSCRTEDLNGKRVLIVEGRYKETQNDMFEVLLDCEGNGRIIQEIFFMCPKDSYLQFSRIAKEAFGSLIWKGGPGDEEPEYEEPKEEDLIHSMAQAIGEVHPADIQEEARKPPKKPTIELDHFLDELDLALSTTTDSSDDTSSNSTDAESTDDEPTSAETFDASPDEERDTSRDPEVFGP